MIIKLLFVLSCVGILYGSTISNHAIIPPFNNSDKIQHLLVYILVGSLGFISYPRSRHRIFFGLLIFGIFIEVIQSFIPYRRADLIDCTFSFMGLLLAFALIKLIGIK